MRALQPVPSSCAAVCMVRAGEGLVGAVLSVPEALV